MGLEFQIVMLRDEPPPQHSRKTRTKLRENGAEKVYKSHENHMKNVQKSHGNYRYEPDRFVADRWTDLL